ncbi:hypothetical protein [Gaetbulibacter jejuensis]|uniref:STAS domain-containing protein n=1 Tax=Gaetbulibacter jejuensis TaxID=584607 RepID=A0ABP3UZX5_9FLAO
MTSEIRIDDFRFKVEDNIIYCEVSNSYDSNQTEAAVEKIFSKVIASLSGGKYMPIIINIENVGFFKAIKIFKFLVNNSILNSLVLSKTFLVDSYLLKGVLTVYSFMCNPIIPDRVFKTLRMAIRHCDKNNIIFNGLS